MTKKERILEILSRKEAATPVKDTLLAAARGGIRGDTISDLISKRSRKRRIDDILLALGMTLGAVGGYAAGGYAAKKLFPPRTGSVKETYDPVVDGANPSIQDS